MTRSRILDILYLKINKIPCDCHHASFSFPKAILSHHLCFFCTDTDAKVASIYSQFPLTQAMNSIYYVVVGKQCYFGSG